MTLLNTIKKVIESDKFFPPCRFQYENKNEYEKVKDLIKRMLKYDETDRISWEELFEHELFQEYY